MSENFGRSIAFVRAVQVQVYDRLDKKPGWSAGIMDRTTSLFLKPISFISHDT